MAIRAWALTHQRVRHVRPSPIGYATPRSEMSGETKTTLWYPLLMDRIKKKVGAFFSFSAMLEAWAAIWEAAALATVAAC